MDNNILVNFEEIQEQASLSEITIPLLVVFDIDETLLQFIGPLAYKYWEELDISLKNKLYEKTTIYDNPEKRQCIIFRPHIIDLLYFVKNNNTWLKIALWTYSDYEYAQSIKNIMIRIFNLPEDIFEFAWCDEDMFEDDYSPKDLSLIWDKYEQFNKFNTFIVDDLLTNINHENNKKNSIYIDKFAPFGATKQRENATEIMIDNAINDNIFLHLIFIICLIKIDIAGCSNEDIIEAWNNESIFDIDKWNKRNNNKILNYFNNNIPQMLQIKNISAGGKKKSNKKRSNKKRSNKKVKKSKNN